MFKNTRQIGISIVLAVLLLSVAFAGAAAADTPVIEEEPTVVTDLVYNSACHQLLASYGKASGGSAYTYMEFSLDGKTWVHNTKDIKSTIVGKDAGIYTIYYRACTLTQDANSQDVHEEYSEVKTCTTSIEKAANPIYLVANNDSKVFGKSDPPLSIGFEGKVYQGDSTSGLDYTVNRDGGENVGEYTIYVIPNNNSALETLEKNYTIETRDGIFTITPLELSDVKAGTIPDQVYTGSAITPGVTVTSSTNPTEGKDYEFSYKDNVNAGTATLTVSPVDGSNYTFSPINVQFKILKADQKNVNVVMDDYIVGTTPSTPSISSAKGDPEITYYYTTSESASAGEIWGPSQPLSVGTYYMYAVLDPTDNYNGYTTEKTEFQVLKDTNTLTVYYKFEDGATASSTYTESVHVGNTYSVKSPDIPGYTPSQAYVSGTMHYEDVTGTVVYSKKSGNYYSLTVRYLYKDGTTASPEYHARYLYGEAYSVPSPEIDGYTASRLTVTGIMGDFDIVEPVYYTENPDTKHTLTIQYVYENGINAEKPKAILYSENEPYSVTSPEISGYTPDSPVVSGTMGTTDILKTVTYTKNSGTSHLLTINYSYTDGKTASLSYTGWYEYNQAYSVSSPAIDGYLASRPVVSGIMGSDDIVESVFYSKNAGDKHTLTIRYVYTNGITAAPTYTGLYSANDRYSVISPKISGYTADQSVISGTMGTSDISKEVTYTKNSSSGGHSGSVKTIYTGTYTGNNTYVFNYNDIIVTKIIVPIDSDTTQSVSWWEEDGAMPAGGWYQFEFDAPGFATGRNGTVYFQVSDAVLSSHKLSGTGDHDVTLYRNGEKIPTYYEGSGDGYVYYTGEVSADGVYDIVFEAGSTLDHQTSSGSSQTGTGETTPVKTASSPVPLAGVLGGLAVIGVLAARMRR